MKTSSPHNNSRSGFALLAVMCFTAIILSFLAMVVFTTTQRTHTVNRLTNQIKAEMIAEAGCELGYSILSTDWDTRFTPEVFDFSESNGETGIKSGVIDQSQLKINVTTVGDNTAILRSPATSNGAIYTSIVSMQNIGGSDDDGDVLSGIAFEYAILCGGEFDFTGCGTILSPSGTAKFHSNGDMFLRGTTDALINLSSSTSITINNNVTVGGSLSAPELSYKASKVTIGGTTTETDVDIVEIPDIDFTPYYNYALENGEVYNGYMSTSSYTPNGGIIWVNGDVHISSHAVISGSIIATGDISISGSADIDPTKTAIALATRDGDINITSSGTITGLIYAKTGGLQHTANGNISGQIIVNGDIKKAGNSDIITTFASNVPSPPGGTTLTDFISVTAWQQ